MAKGSALKGALAASPRGGRVTSLSVGAPPQGAAQSAGQRAGLQRVSPGMYRNPQGQLVGSRGQSLPNQQPQRPSMQVPQPYAQQVNPGNEMPLNMPGMDGMTNGATAGVRPAFNTKPFMFPQQPGMQPQPQQGMYKDPGYFQNPNLAGNVVAEIGRGMQPWQQSGPIFAGGSPNFNEMTGQYDPAKLAVTQAAMRGMQQFGQMPGMENQQFAPYPGQIQSGYLRAPQGQEPMQMEDLRYVTSQKPQNLPGMFQRNR